MSAVAVWVCRSVYSATSPCKPFEKSILCLLRTHICLGHQVSCNAFFLLAWKNFETSSTWNEIFYFAHIFSLIINNHLCDKVNNGKHFYYFPRLFHPSEGCYHGKYTGILLTDKIFMGFITNYHLIHRHSGWLCKCLITIEKKIAIKLSTWYN